MTFHLKKVFIMIVVVILVGGMMNSVPAAEGELLVRAMEATGAQVEEFSINSWAQLPPGPRSDEQLGEIVQQIMMELGVTPTNYQLTQYQKNAQRIVQATGKVSDLHILTAMQSLPSKVANGEKEYYLIITIEGQKTANLSVNHLQGEIRRITKKNGAQSHISTCLIGWLNGTLRDGKQQDLLQHAYQVVDAKIVHKLETENLISYTGFTSKLMEWLQVGSEKVNLNMAMRYSGYDNRTYITIGSPIITREY